MNMLINLSIVLSVSSFMVLADESFSGSGTFACYGDMSITFDKANSAGEGEGFLDCKPAWGSAAAPPQVGTGEITGTHSGVALTDLWKLSKRGKF